MEIWFVVFILAYAALFLLHIYFGKKYPVLYMPFDHQYRVLKGAYRAYRPVREGKKLYNVFADDFLCGYRRTLEKKASSEEYAVFNRVSNIIENHREKIERYFSGKFGYSDYLNLKSEYDLFQEQVIEQTTLQDPVILVRKLLLFESLFRVCKVDTSKTNKVRFICDLLGIKPNTPDIRNSYVYDRMKDITKMPQTKDEINARISDYEYVVRQLGYLKLERECTIILNEINELKSSIDE